MATPIDPLYPSQWHFGLIGDIETIWDEFSGIDISVAVYDDGLERTHVDLDDNYDASLHFSDGGTVYDPISATDPHATAVAGIIAAERNEVGGVGVAWSATVTGVDFVDTLQNEPDAETLMVTALRHAASFDVMNNSWSETDNYGYTAGLLSTTPNPDTGGSLGDPTSRNAIWDSAYAHATATGRDGLGTVIVQAAGNDSSNANGYGLNASRHSITVAATDQAGQATIFSDWGTAILVSAPAAAVTTDLMGTAGYNIDRDTGDYTTTFDGTSAAAPVVSGVAALMLEANPGLGWRDVQNILALSAAMTGSGYGADAAGLERSNWADNGATTFNGGGATFHYSYGFGLVDAFAAVRMAEVWLEMHGAAQTTTNEATVSAAYSGAAVAIPDPGALDPAAEITLNVTEDILIESLAVTISATHDFASETVWTLVAPDGTEVPFLVNEGLQYLKLGGFFEMGDAMMENGLTWTFAINAFLGHSSAGDWTLKVEDQGTEGTGEITGFSLDFYGAAATVDTVYTFTDDFLELAGIDADRTSIADSDGGTDWLNLAAIADDVTLLLGIGDLDVDGTDWATVATGVENAATGDGNDYVSGDTWNNRFLLGRGDDTAKGGHGADTLEGGQGMDELMGGKGADALFGDAGNDILNGGGDKDSLGGGAGDDTLDGAFGKDKLMGGAGNDSLIGGGGNGEDRLFGGAGNDTLIGSAGDNRLNGGGGSDLIEGGDGDDRLTGAGGIDTLDGGAGNDTMSGGDKADSFVYRTDGAVDADTITDFTDDVDILQLTDLGYTAALNGANLELTWASGHSLTLLGWTDAGLLNDDVAVLSV